MEYVEIRAQYCLHCDRKLSARRTAREFATRAGDDDFSFDGIAHEFVDRSASVDGARIAAPTASDAAVKMSSTIIR